MTNATAEQMAEERAKARRLCAPTGLQTEDDIETTDASC